MASNRDRTSRRRKGTYGGVAVAAVLCLGLAASLPVKAQDLDWAKRAGGTNDDRGGGIARDGAGNSYVTGQFVGTATFGPGESNQTTLTAAGSGDIFVAKYNASGDLVWAKRAGGTSGDGGAGIVTDSAGNSYVTGSFAGTATFGPGDANQTILTSAAGSADIFVAKYDASGALVWAKRAGGASGDSGQGIVTDSAGNSYVTGSFRDTATFGPGEANQTPLTSAGFLDIFVAKYDASGDLVWAKRAGGTGGTSQDQGFGIATDGAGNSYVTGRFGSTATFGPGEANETILTSVGGLDFFIAKYDASGDLVWVKRAGGGNGDQGSGIATDSAGNSYVTGLFQFAATFGSGEANETTLTSSGNNIFVAKYDSGGDLAWAKTTSGASAGGGDGIATDGAGNSYVTGQFNGTATFGPGEPHQTTLTSAGQADIFVAKYDAGGALAWAKRAGGTGTDQGAGIVTDVAGSSYVTGNFGLFALPAVFGPGEANETTLTSAGIFDIFVARFSGVVDSDGDGIADDEDNCPDDANPDQIDTDGEEEGDACDADDDNDTVADAGDNCPLDANTDQADADGDGFGNVCDSDDDNDGVIDGADLCVPTGTGQVVNADGCAIADLCPCGNEWKNHGAYVSCTAKMAEDFLDLGLITEAEKDTIVAAAGESQCGSKK